MRSDLRCVGTWHRWEEATQGLREGSGHTAWLGCLRSMGWWRERLDAILRMRLLKTWEMLVLCSSMVWMSGRTLVFRKWVVRTGFRCRRTRE
jgi:hypothetical protein